MNALQAHWSSPGTCLRVRERASCAPTNIFGHNTAGSALPQPTRLQIKLPPTGARLIIASDGLWDAMPAGRVARVLRSQPTAKSAAMQAVSGVAASLGGLLRDDVTGGVGSARLQPPAAFLQGWMRG